jgi:hypothetical protein
LHCKILLNVIKADKKLHYDKIILNSENKTKSTWNIVKPKTIKNESKEGIHLLNNNGVITQILQTIAGSFNVCFLTTADEVMNKSRNINTGQANNNNF